MKQSDNLARGFGHVWLLAGVAMIVIGIWQSIIGQIPSAILSMGVGVVAAFFGMYVSGPFLHIAGDDSGHGGGAE